MPSIVIQEKDETLAGNAASSVDVAFVPGFADTNSNYIILTESGLDPQQLGLLGCVPAAADSEATHKNIHIKKYARACYACNTVDERTWVCKARATDAAGDESNQWLEQENYIAPCPENYPVLCSTVAEFEAYFGNEPYKFTEDQNMVDFFETGVIAKGNKYMYKAGDYEKSYIYAKELIKLGIPVIYENICARGDSSVDVSTKKFIRTRTDVTSVSIAKDAYEAKVGTRKSETINFSYVGDGKFVNGAVELDSTIITFNPLGASVYYGDVVTIKPNTAQTDYTAAFHKVADPTILSVDEDVLLQHMKAVEMTSINYTLKHDGTAWKLGTDTITLAELGITISNIAGKDDTIKLIATYTVSYDKIAPTVKYFYEHVSDCFTNSEKLLDKGELTVKYITCGAYPVYELKEQYAVIPAMITCAHDRGDAVAIIDHANNAERSLKTTEGSGSVYAHIVKSEGNGLMNTDEYNAFATMFTPWATYSCVTAPKGATTQLMPASFAYLTSVGVSIVTNANFLAVAGVNRGIPSTIKELNTIERLSNTIADAYQPRDKRALNAITNIKPYGLTIWGNRTLVSNADGNLTATSFLNVRNMVSDIKKVAYSAAKSLIYEQDSEILWGKFKNKLTPTLDRMVNGYGLSSYKIIRATTKYNGEGLAKGEVAAVIKIYPVYAVEDFEITVVMADDEVSVN